MNLYESLMSPLLITWAIKKKRNNKEGTMKYFHCRARDTRIYKLEILKEVSGGYILKHWTKKPFKFFCEEKLIMDKKDNSVVLRGSDLNSCCDRQIDSYLEYKQNKKKNGGKIIIKFSTSSNGKTQKMHTNKSKLIFLNKKLETLKTQKKICSTEQLPVFEEEVEDTKRRIKEIQMRTSKASTDNPWENEWI